MAKIRLNVVVDLANALNIKRYSQNNKPKLVETAANRYLQYSRNRYISLSAGGGEWPGLKLTTVARKIRRGIADDPTAILRESDTILNELQVKIIGKVTYVGIFSNRMHPRGPAITKLALIHTVGTILIDARPIVVSPPNQVRKRMVDDIRTTYNKLIRQQRKR